MAERWPGRGLGESVGRAILEAKSWLPDPGLRLKEQGLRGDLRSGRHWAWDSGTWLPMGLTLAVGADGVWNSIFVRESQGTRTQGRRRSEA